VIPQVQAVNYWPHDCQKVCSPADDVKAGGYNTAMMDAKPTISYLGRHMDRFLRERAEHEKSEPKSRNIPVPLAFGLVPVVYITPTGRLVRILSGGECKQAHSML
jgi:hypothetical protein